MKDTPALSCFRAISTSIAGWLILCLPVSATTELNSIHFKPGQPLAGQSLGESISSPGYFQMMDQAISVFKAHPEILIEVHGHTDSSECSPGDCLMLSTRRAELVTRYLIEHGLPPKQIFAVSGFGSRHPLLSDPHTVSDREANRRVEFSRKF
ncbi:OmpA family protein [Solilutibacter silvestris]|uniref:OmpA family protein n=1 Tax=Solilutibacter silvestris TaxID=1645665 RepID=UPI003D338D40